MEHARSGPEGAAFDLVVGAGPVGSEVARELLDRGRSVVVVTRSGTVPDVGPERGGGRLHAVAADAGDAARMGVVARGAATVFNCANPTYHRWSTDWPPIASALLAAAEGAGAVLVTVSNLYGYGPATASLGVPAYDADHPMTEATPLAALGTKGRVRSAMWEEALAAHRAGRVRVAEVRASDYLGAGANSVIDSQVLRALLRGRAATVLGRADRLHTWSVPADVARLAVTAALDSRAWGRAWHTPSGPPRTQHEVATDLARVAGLAPIRLRAVPHPVLVGAGVFSPILRELRETEYQFRDDFVMDSAAATETFGLRPTPWEDALAAALVRNGWTGECPPGDRSTVTAGARP